MIPNSENYNFKADLFAKMSDYIDTSHTCIL